MYMQAILHKLLSPFRWGLPRHAILRKDLHRGPQFRLVQGEIVHTANAQDAHARERRADAVHKRAARRTEVIRHRVVLAGSLDEDRARLAVRLQLFLPPQVLQVRVVDREVDRVHRCGELVAVGAVTQMKEPTKPGPWVG